MKAVNVHCDADSLPHVGVVSVLMEAVQVVRVPVRFTKRGRRTGRSYIETLIKHYQQECNGHAWQSFL